MLDYKDIILMENAAIIHQKNKIIDELVIFFAELLERYKKVSFIAAEEYSSVFNRNGKVSKGEKLEGLPWVTLDYPRCFDETNGFFAIRTIFWWGNFIKIELLTSGKYKEIVTDKINSCGNFEFGYTANPWTHERGRLNPDTHLPYCKIVEYYSLKEIFGIKERLISDYQFFLTLVKQKSEV